MVTRESNSTDTFFGKYNDTKPTDGVTNGSMYLATDVLAAWIYDEEDGDWNVLYDSTQSGG